MWRVARGRFGSGRCSRNWASAHSHARWVLDGSSRGTQRSLPLPRHALSTAAALHSTPRVRIGEEPDAAQGTGRLNNPSTHLPGARGQRDSKHAGMPSHDRAMNVCVRKHQNGGDHFGRPSALPPNDRRHDSRLHVQGPNGFLQVHQLGLDFHDQERPAIGSPGQDVDRPALAETVERLLDADFPAKVQEQAHGAVLQVRVPPIEQTGELGTPPSQPERQVRLDRLGSRLEYAG